MKKYNTYNLRNGLRVIHLGSTSPVVYCGYVIAAGTRDELFGQEGLAHFCEHVSFKGTEHRHAMQVATQCTDAIRIGDNLTHTIVVGVECSGTNDDATLDVVRQIELRWYRIDNGVDVRL